MLCVQCACLHKRLHTLVGSALFHNGWFSSGCLFSMAWAWAEGEILILLCLLLVDTFHFDGGKGFHVLVLTISILRVLLFHFCITYFSGFHVSLLHDEPILGMPRFWEHLVWPANINIWIMPIKWYIHLFNEGVYCQQLRWRWSEDRERERVLAWSILLSSGRSCCPHTLSPTST